jgi:hypothetical protein
MLAVVLLVSLLVFGCAGQERDAVAHVKEVRTVACSLDAGHGRRSAEPMAPQLLLAPASVWQALGSGYDCMYAEAT